MLHWFDTEIIRWLNQFVGRSDVFDRAMVLTIQVDLIRTVPMVAGIWWIWFSGPDESSRKKNRFIAFAGTAGVFLACLVSRLTQDFMPERARPIYAPDLHLTVPSTLPSGIVADFSSFPSDTSALAFSLATVLWLYSRPVGALAYFWALVVVSLPRLYLGIHYPLDVVAGAVIGVGAVVLLVGSPLKVGVNRLLNEVVLPLEARFTGPFYAGLFVASYLVATLFDDVRFLGRAFVKLLKALHGG